MNTASTKATISEDSTVPSKPFSMHKSRISALSSGSTSSKTPIPLTPFPFALNSEPGEPEEEAEEAEAEAEQDQEDGGKEEEDQQDGAESGQLQPIDKSPGQGSVLPQGRSLQGGTQTSDPSKTIDNNNNDNSNNNNIPSSSAVHFAETPSPPTRLTTENVSAIRNQSVSFNTPHQLTSRIPKSFTQRRQSAIRRSIPEIPRPSILKALVARTPQSPNPALQSTTTTTVAPAQPNVTAHAIMPPPPLAPACGNMHNDDIGPMGLSAASALELETPRPLANAILQSPCFYHQRFDQVVDFEKVLDEIAMDENMSHSRLVRTATGVREVSRQLQRRPIKAAVKNVMIVTKARDNSLVTLTREITEWLMRKPRYGNKHGVNVYVDKKLKHSKRFNAAGLLEDEPAFADMLHYWTPDLCWTSPEKFDLVLTLGGDGTVLFTSWLFQRIVPPILSFSLGSLGFLTNFKFDLYKQHLDKVLTDGMRVNLRMRFTCTVYRHQPNGEPIEAEKFEVLNELVIDRGPSPYVSNMELYGDDNLITVVQADGCIFSTPTGSTAYSLSAGGSLVHPDIPATLITPICPHTLSFRPMILSDSVLLRVNIPKTSRATAFAAFDGRARLELKQGDYITLAASQYPFPTVLSQPQEWIDSIQRTLKWNTRAADQKAFTKDDGDGEHDIDGNSEVWDIDTDSGVYSDDGNGSATSPLRRSMSLLMT